ncbi:hypothetical protein HBI12_213330 [Parastagonospora nodorum]|nr:hypothetical protein HBI12_213330 [Parastagonospora nodorum]
MSQTNVREGYKITTLEIIKLIEDLISYIKKKDLLEKIQSEKIAKYTQLRNAQIPKVFYEAAYSAKVKTENLSNTLTLTLSKTAQRQSLSVVSNRSTALITNKFSVASLTKPAILNNANVALVDAVHHSVVKQFSMFRLMTKESQQKLEENYFKVIDALTMTLIKDDDNLLGTVNSHIKLRRLRAVILLCQTIKPLGNSNKVTFQPNEPPEQPLLPEQPSPPKKRADSRYAKASRGRTKKDKDSEDSDTSSDVLRLRRRDRAAARAQLAKRKQLGKEAQLKKTRDEEELAKAKKEKEKKEAQERKTQLDSPLDSDNYRSDSSLDIDPEDNSEDEEATTAKDLAREQKERLKALLNAKTRDGFSARVGTAIEHYAYILYFKELLSNNSRIFANAISIGKTRAIVLATEVQNAQAEGNATEHNAVNDNNKPCPTKGERTFHCACKRSPSFNAKPQQAATMMTTLQFCFFSNSPLENIGRLTKEKAIEMRINTTNAISKALAAANKLVALQSYTIPEANTPAVHPKATKHRPAPSAAQFVIVCSFEKVDKHVFRAYNTISVTAQRTIIRKGGPYVEKRAILLPSHVTVWGRTVFDEFHNCKLESTIIAKDSVTSNRIYKIEDAVYHCLYLDFLSTVQNAKQQCRDILEKEGLNESEASRRVIFNCFKMQAIASYPALTTLKAAYVKDLFTNLSKDYFLVREARAITKSSPKFQNLSNLCSKSIAAEDVAKAANTLPPPKEVRAKILIESYKLIVQAIIVALIAFAEAITLTEATHVVIIEPQDSQLAEMCVGIIYFNLDSKLELKVLSKQDVKTTS